MSKEIQKTQSSQLPSTDFSDWGAEEFRGGQDVLISKIWPMQGMSKFVMDGDAKMGEFRDSVTGALIGDIDDGIELVPFYLQKTWDIQEQQPDGQFKWVRSEPLVENPMSPGYNDNLPWEDVVNGLKVRRIRRLNYFVLRPEDVEKGGPMPYVMTFKSTSLKAGKKLYTQMYVRNKMEQLPPPGYLVKVTGEKVKNDKGVFVVLDTAQGRRANEKELAACKAWIQEIRKGSVKVDESDVQGEAEVSSDLGTGEF